MTRDRVAATRSSAGAPYWSRVLRALREARGITRDGWAAALGYGRTTVQRWETGETVPDAAAEAAIIAQCRERALFHRYDEGPLAGVILTAEWLSELLAGARLGTGDRVAIAQHSASSTQHSNLPLPLTSFVGREAERAKVAHLLGESRLLTLTGTGGAGKTRLALETARGLLGEGELSDGAGLETRPYGDGVWLVELAAIADPALVPSVTATALGVRETAGQAPVGALATFLESRHLLLLLDNCEHLVSACARLAGALLSTCPGLTILATSREPLGVPGEVVWRVPPMALPAVTGQPAVGSRQSEGMAATQSSVLSPQSSDAVRLFVERARMVRPSFAPGEAEMAAVARICGRLDGMPLAIELAAARLNVLSVEQIAERLSDRFRLLGAGSRTAMPRHQTLRALVDWSYELLDEEERWLFEELSVFAGSFSIEAVESICGIGTDGLDILGRLVDKSLVVVEEKQGVARYRLLETLRQYAQERLDARDALTAVRSRHRDYYLALAEQAEPELRGPEQVQWLERIFSGLDNFRAALRWCEQAPAGTEAGLRLASALLRFWEVRGLFSEGRGWLDRLLAMGADIPSSVQVRALNAAGTLAIGQGNYSAAGRFHEQALALARSDGDAAGAAWALVNFGLVRASLGDDEAAEALIEEGLAIRRDLGDQRETARALFNLGYVAHRRGDFGRAREMYEEYLAIMRELGHTEAIAGTLNNLADLALRQGEYGRAQTLFEESLELRRQLGDERGVVFALHGLGETAMSQGSHATAGSLFAESLLIAQRLRMQRNVAECLEGLAGVAVVSA
ncbi:MAG: ATP-binding protein, partial [Dehalococcoidia bacterium]